PNPPRPGTETWYSPGPTFSIRKLPSAWTCAGGGGGENIIPEPAGARDTAIARSVDTCPSIRTRPGIDTAGVIVSTRLSISLPPTSTATRAEGGDGGRSPGFGGRIIGICARIQY